jgi:hypothetical protein
LISGPELLEFLDSHFSMKQGYKVCSKLPRRYHEHWLANMTDFESTKSEFTPEEVNTAIIKSGIDKGFWAWVDRHLNGQSPGDFIRRQFSLS